MGGCEPVRVTVSHYRDIRVSSGACIRGYDPWGEKEGMETKE